jgi:ABC-type Fe3+ transport system permease subunit
MLFIWSLVLFGLPSSLHSLGIVFAGSSTSGILQSSIRSGWMVGVGQGIHFFPIALAIVAGAWLGLPPSYIDASTIHGLGTLRFVSRIAGPLIAPSVLAAAVIVCLLALSDMSSLMLLQPPGWVTYPTQVFAMLDNSSERKLAALGLVYLLFPAMLIAAVGITNIIYRIYSSIQEKLRF